MNLPNKLTVGRMFAIPLIIILSLITKLDEIVITSTNNYIISLQDYLIFGVFLIAAFIDF